MPKVYYILLVCFLMFTSVNAQELNCTIDVNSSQIQGTNKQVFQTLQTALTEFMNNKQWTAKKYKQQERIECGMTFIISSVEGNNFKGTLQVNAVRPVFGSTYKSPIFNFKDAEIAFSYIEFEPLNFNATTFVSNLMSLMSFYAYTIIGIDADTFSDKGGSLQYKKAFDIANLAQQGGSDGWTSERNKLNRFALIDQILAPGHKEYRDILYKYHRKGFDVFSKNKKDAKKEILNSILNFSDLFKRNQNSFLIRTFFDAKADEIVSVFNDGPKMNTSKLVNSLTRMSALNNSKWQKIK